MTTNIEMNESRREIEELLPWYAAGVATPEEARRVEAALAADPDLKRSFELVREDQDAVIIGNETVKAPSSRAYEKFIAALEAEPARSAPIAARMSRGVMGFIEGALAALSPRRLAYAGAAAAVIVMLQAAVIGGLVLREQGDNGMRVASTGEQATDRGTFVRISFVPTANAGEIASTLRRLGATIEGGPDSNGLFRVRVSGDVLDTAARDAKVAQLQAERTIVRLVLPAQTPAR